MKTLAVVPGTFDPITLGHVDVIERATKLFDHVIVAVAASVGKGGAGPVFSIEERVKLAQQSLAHTKAEVFPMEGLLVDFCAEKGAQVVVKGLRATTDFEYELAQADINQKLNNKLESLFIMARPQYGYISSSSVREMARLGAPMEEFVPAPVLIALSERYGA